MKTDDFEKRLQRLPQREIPGAWRTEVLAKAPESAAPFQSAHRPRPSLLQLIQTLLSRPQRIAWAGLAGAWLMILAMNFAAQDNSPATVQSASLPTPEKLQALKQQKRLLAELVDRPAALVTDRRKNIPTGPHSQRREEITTV